MMKRLFLLAVLFILLWSAKQTIAQVDVSVGVVNIGPTITPPDLKGANLINGGQTFILGTTVTDQNGCADITCPTGCEAKCWASFLGENEPSACSDCNCITSSTFTLQSGCTGSTRSINFTGLQFSAKAPAGPVLCIVKVKDSAGNLVVSSPNPFNLEPGSGAAVDSVTISFPPSPPGSMNVPATAEVGISNPTNTLGSMDMSMSNNLQKTGAPTQQIPKNYFTMFSTQDYTPFISSDTLLYVDFDGRAPAATAEGTIAIWHFSEGTTASTSDSSTNNNVGTLGDSTAAPTWVEGRYGKGLYFDGTNDYISVTDSTSLEPTNQYSIAFWMKTGMTATYGFIVSKSSSGSGGGYEVFLNNGRIRFSSCDSAGSCANGYFNITTPSTYNDHNWHHVVATVATGSTAKIYVDGVLTVQSGTVTQDNIQNSYVLNIGKRGGTGYYFNGILDELAIYNRVLGAEEIARLAGKASVDGKSPVAVVNVKPAEGRFSLKPPYLYDNFDDGDYTTNPPWTVQTSGTSWSVRSGRLFATSTGRGEDSAIFQKTLPANTPYVYEADLDHDERESGIIVGGIYVRRSGSNYQLIYGSNPTFSAPFYTHWTAKWSNGVLDFFAGGRKIFSQATTNDGTFGAKFDQNYAGGAQYWDNVKVVPLVGSAYFDGSAYINFGNSTEFNPTAITVMAWVKTEDSTANPGQCGGRFGQIVGKGADNQWQLRMSGDGEACKPKFGVQLASSFPQIISSENLTNGVWYHLAGTYDGSVLRLYVNGVQKASSTVAGSIQSTAFPLAIGARSSNDSSFGYKFYGTIDEVKVFSRALSASEVADIANGNPGKAMSNTAQTFLPNAPPGSCTSNAKTDFSGYISIPNATAAGSFSGAVSLAISGGSPFSGWSYWRTITLTETVGVPRILEPVDVYVPAGSVAKTDCSDFRVTDGGYREISSQVHDCTNGNGNITFLVYVPAGRSVIYRIYYGNPYAPSPQYSTDLKVNISGNSVTVQNGKLYANYGKETYCGLVDFWLKGANVDAASIYSMGQNLQNLASGCTPDYQVRAKGPIFVEVSRGSTNFDRYYAMNSFVDSIWPGTTTTTTSGYPSGTSFTPGFAYLATPWTSWWVGNNANVSGCGGDNCPTLTVDRTLMMFSKETSPAFSLYLVGPSGFNRWDAQEFRADESGNAERGQWWNSGSTVTVRNAYRYGLTTSTNYNDIVNAYDRFNNPLSMVLGSQQTNS